MAKVKRALGIAAIALTAAACGNAATPSRTKTVTSTVTVTMPASTTVATTVASSPLFTLVSKPRSEMTQRSFMGAVPHGIYLSVSSLWIQNISARPQTFVIHDQRLIDAQGREFSPDMHATEEADINEVNPGNTMFRDDTYFDVPNGTQLSDYRLVLHDSAGIFAIVQLGG